MKRLRIALVAHDARKQELVEEVSTYSKAGDKLPYKRTLVYVCKKCGKFKQLTIQ